MEIIVCYKYNKIYIVIFVIYILLAIELVILRVF